MLVRGTMGDERQLRILLEGRPGVGKTTVVRRLASLLGQARVALRGFTTEEIRESGRRVGFAVETFDGRRTILAHVNLPGPPRVSRYGVDVDAFERIALPALAGIRKDELVVIDELGKMELASEPFCAAVSDIFDSAGSIVATIQIARHPFTEVLKQRAGVETVRVSEQSRDELPNQLAGRLQHPRRAGWAHHLL